MNVAFTLNNRLVEVKVRPDEFLLDTLRKLGCTSVRRGCDTGSCGICTVWLDYKPILSCSYLTVRAAGKSVITLEGVREEAQDLIDFLAEEGADQCGYCAPGFIMTILAMKRELRNPSEEEIYHYLNGTLCRCTGYKGQIRAVKRYLDKHLKGEGIL